MRGKLLSIEEVGRLGNGIKVWLEKGENLDSVYNNESKVYEVKGEKFSCNNETAYEYANIYKDGFAVKGGKIKVYEYLEEVIVKEYKGWEILKMIEEGELKPKDKVIANGNFEFYVSETGTLRYSSNGHEIDSSYFNNSNKYILVEEVSVSFMEAAKAFSEGKTIECKREEGYQTKYTHDTGKTGMVDEDGAAVCADEILKGKWFVS